MEILSFNDSKFSIVNSGGITNVYPDSEISLSELIKIYQSQKIRDTSFQIAMATEKKEQMRLKLLLPYFTPYITFKPTRANKNAQSYNKNILAIDIDFKESQYINEVIQTFEILRNLKSCIFVSYSARGLGVRALFRVEYDFEITNDKDETGTNFHRLLNKNSTLIAKKLKLPYDCLDHMAFVFSQPFFISNNGKFYFNPEPENLLLSVVQESKEEKQFAKEQQEKKKLFTPIPIPAAKRPAIEKILKHKANQVLKKLDYSSENRHTQIMKFTYLFEYIHYANDPESYFNAALNHIYSLYGSSEEARQQNAYKSLRNVYEKAANKRDPDIDFIINSK